MKKLLQILCVIFMVFMVFNRFNILTLLFYLLCMCVCACGHFFQHCVNSEIIQMVFIIYHNHETRKVNEVVTGSYYISIRHCTTF